MSIISGSLAICDTRDCGRKTVPYVTWVPFKTRENAFDDTNWVLTLGSLKFKNWGKRKRKFTLTLFNSIWKARPASRNLRFLSSNFSSICWSSASSFFCKKSEQWFPITFPHISARCHITSVITKVRLLKVVGSLPNTAVPISSSQVKFSLLE